MADQEDQLELELDSDRISSISRSTDEYQYWRSTGLSHVEAKNRVIDQYRKYWSREVLHSDVPEDEFYGPGSQPSPDSIAEINELVQKFLQNCPDTKVQKMFVAICRGIGVDEYFSDVANELCSAVLPPIESDIKERKLCNRYLAAIFNYRIRASDSKCTPISTLKARLRSEMRRIFGDIDR